MPSIARVAAAACVCVLALGGLADAQTRAPLTLADAQTRTPLTLADALALAAKAEGTDAVRSLGLANDDTARARTSLRTSVSTVVSAQPQAGSPLQFLAEPLFTVDFGSAARRAGTLQSARSALAQTGAALATTQRAAALTVIDAFFDVAAGQAQLAAQDDAVALATETLTFATLRHRNGVAPQLDVDRAQAQLATFEAERDAARATLGDDRDLVGELLGAPPPASVATDPLPAALPDAAAVEAASLQNDPAVGAAQAAYRSAQAAATLARATLEPAVSAGAGPGYSRIGRADFLAPAGSVTLDVPVGNRLERANATAADAAVLVARAELDQSRRQTTRDALHARAVAAGAFARLRKLTEADDRTRRVADADVAGYRLGAVSGTDLVFAQVQASAARAALENARIVAARAYADLRLDMGELGR